MRLCATTGQRHERSGGRDLQSTSLGAGDDGAGERMLGVCLDGRCQPEGVGVAGIDEHRLTAGEGPGLVEHDHIDGPRALQGQAILDEKAVGGPERRRDGDDKGNREAQRMGACDDQDRRRADHRTLWVALQPPEHEGDRASRQGDVEQDSGRPVSEGLGVGCRCLGGGDHPHDP